MKEHRDSRPQLGGYQIAYMLTRTNRSESPSRGACGNMTSAFNGIRWDGLPRHSNTKDAKPDRGTLWDNPLEFVEILPSSAQTGSPRPCSSSK